MHVSSGTGFASCGNYSNTAVLSAATAPPVTSNTATEAVLCPNLAASKTADAATVSAGTAIGFTVTASNTGAGTATSASLSDSLPAGTGFPWTISPAYAGPGSCSIAPAVAGPQTLTCSFGDLAPGASASVHVTSATGFASCGTYSNSANLRATNHPAVTSNTATTTVQCPAPMVTKAADAASVSAGTAIGFTVTAMNGSAPGTGTLTGATLSDTLPAGSGIAWSISPAYAGPGTCSIAGQTLTCSFGDLAPGASASVHVSSPTGFASCGTYSNSAALSATNAPTVTSNTATTTVQCPAPMVTKAADAATVNAGTAIGFTVTAMNGSAPGTGTLTGATLSDPLPAGPAGSGVSWAINPAYAGPGTCSITGAAGAQTLSCSFGDLAPGTSASVHVTSATSFASCGTYSNTASLSATNAPTVTSNTSTTTVQCPAPMVTKAADAASVSAGSDIGFTVTAMNGSAPGTSTLTGATLSDTLPAGPKGSVISWSINPAYAGPGSCSITGQTLTCSFGDLAPGASASVHVSSATNFASCATYSNSASLSATNAPTVTSNTATTTVQCPRLTASKTADATDVPAGNSIGFTVTAGNSGAGTATSVGLSDSLPAGSGFPWTISPANAACSIAPAVAGPQTLTCSFGNLASGASASVHVTSATNCVSSASYSNSANVSAANAPTVTSNTATENVTFFNCIGLRVADVTAVQPGVNVWYEVARSSRFRARARVTPLLAVSGSVRSEAVAGDLQAASVPSGYSFDGDRASVTILVKAPSAPFTVRQRSTCNPPPTAGTPTTCTITETVTNNSGHRQRFDQVRNQIPGNLTVAGQSSKHGTIKTSGHQVGWSGFTLGPQSSATATIQVTFTPTQTEVGHHVSLSLGIHATAVDLTTGKRYTTGYGTLLTNVRVITLPQTGSGGSVHRAAVSALPQTGGGAGAHR